jgi:hypothetical protein
MERAVQDITERLAEAFEYSAIWYLEKAEMDGDLTDEEGRNVRAFYALQESVKEMSPALTEQIAELAAKRPDAFEQSLLMLLGRVNDQFRPATAAEFVTKLIDDTRRMTKAQMVASC